MSNLEAQPLVDDPVRCVGIPQESNASGISSNGQWETGIYICISPAMPQQRAIVVLGLICK